MFIAALLGDLQAHYKFSGKKTHKVGIFDIFKGLFNPRVMPVIIFRISHVLYIYKLGWVARIVSLFNFIIFGIEIAMRCDIGKGLYLPHTIGTVIGALKIGENAVIYHGVTLGAKDMDLGYSSNKRPVVGNNVIIGSGAKILGGIKIGDNVTIGANSVVVNDIPQNVVVAGIPAIIIKERYKKADE